VDNGAVSSNNSAPMTEMQTEKWELGRRIKFVFTV